MCCSPAEIYIHQKQWGWRKCWVRKTTPSSPQKLSMILSPWRIHRKYTTILYCKSYSTNYMSISHYWNNTVWKTNDLWNYSSAELEFLVRILFIYLLFIIYLFIFWCQLHLTISRRGSIRWWLAQGCFEWSSLGIEL